MNESTSLVNTDSEDDYTKLKDSCLILSMKANRRASIFSVIAVLSQLATIVIALAISILSLVSGDGDPRERLITGILASVAVAIQSLHTVFSFESRGMKYKQLYRDTYTLFLKIRELESRELTDAAFDAKLKSYNTILLNYEVILYDINMMNIASTDDIVKKIPEELKHGKRTKGRPRSKHRSVSTL